MLDTNIVSDLVRNPGGRSTRRISEVGEHAVCTSVIVASELWYGAVKRDSARLTIQLEAVLSAIEIAPLETPVERVYGELRARLERVGRPIGGNDLLIAAQSVALGLVLVTDNEREFSRIDELSCENWLR
ncbi:MAG: type II toxin-antitoxin system VapC family toxin [Vulcanimicrobiaceae bacterium]